MNWQALRDWLVERLTERSSWAGLISGAGIIGGVSVAPDKAAEIASAGAVVAAMIGVLTKEGPKG